VKKPVSWRCERSRRGRSLPAVAPRQLRPSRALPERTSEPRPQMVLILDPRHEPLARYTPRLGLPCSRVPRPRFPRLDRRRGGCFSFAVRAGPDAQPSAEVFRTPSGIQSGLESPGQFELGVARAGGRGRSSRYSDLATWSRSLSPFGLTFKQTIQVRPLPMEAGMLPVRPRRLTVLVLSSLLCNEPHRPSLCLAPRSTSPCALGSTSVLLPRPRLRPPLLPAPLCSLPPLRSRSTSPLPCSATAPFPRHLNRLSSRPPNDHLRCGRCLSTLLLAACSATAPSPVPSPAYPPNRAECLPTFPSSRSGPRSSSGTSLTGTMVSRRLGASPRVRQHIPHSSYHLHTEAACRLGGWVWA
jgi:hypothetical protein